MRDRRFSPCRSIAGLWTLGAIEAATFVALIANLFIGDNPGFRAGLGFLHGCVYLLSLAIAWWWVDDDRARGLAVIPGIGALLLARRLTRTPPPR